MPFDKICAYCEKPYTSVKRTSKYCSQSCAALFRVPETIERNKSRRKYEYDPNLSKAQQSYRAYNGKYKLKDTVKRQTVIMALGGKCVQCGYSANVHGLVLDHINGDGHADRERLGSRIARYYVNNLDEAKEKLQVLCATCNQIKAYEEKEHNKTRRVI